MKNKRMTLKELVEIDFPRYDFDGYWYDAFGSPQTNARWSISGDSGSGKTSFLLKLAGYCTRFGLVGYVSAEEGRQGSVKAAAIRSGLTDEQLGKILIDPKMTYRQILWKMYRNPDVKLWILDSLDSLKLTATEVENMVYNTRLNHTMIAMVQWSDNRGKGANVGSRYLAGIKIEIVNFVATANSRYGGNRQPFIINKELAGKHYAWVNRL